MKKILFTICILSLLLISAVSYLGGWGVQGRVKVVDGGIDGYHAVTGIRSGGEIWQYGSGEIGQYTLTVWCKGNPTIILQQGAQIQSQSCKNSPNWKMLTFQIYKPDLEIFRTSAQLKPSDYVDMFCLYPSEYGSCTYFNHITNYSFEYK